MVDNRSAGHFGIGGAFNFRSGDISGTAAKMQDDKMGSNEYFAQGEKEDEQNQNEQPYVDRSAQLRATLNSLAMMNVASVLNSKKRLSFLEEKNESDENDKDNRDENSDKNLDRDDDENEEFLDDFDENEIEDNEYF